MPSSHPPLVRTRLSMMMFLQFFVWGSWGVAICGYAASLGFAPSKIAWLGAVPAIGAIVSPLFVGLIADRFFSAQRVLGVLHLFGGAFLILAGLQDSFATLMTAMLLNGLAFMPTLALVNSVAFRHLPNPDNFPRIAVLGTIGWIVANLLGEALGGASVPNFLLQAGVGGIVLGLYSFTLPDTPPKGAAGGGDVFGLSALKLFKEPAFLIFIVCVFLLSIPACGYFFTLMVPMFQQRGYPAPLALGTLNQFAELIFMFSMPWFVSKLGLKRVILIGMAAWALRYLCFACPEFSSALLGLVLHGFCYSFFYVGAYMWVDRRAPAELKSSAQSLLAFLLLGVAYLAGAQGAGYMMGRFPAEIPNMPTYSVVEIAETEKADKTDESEEAKETTAVAIPNRVVVKRATDGGGSQILLQFGEGTARLDEVRNALPRWDDPKAKDSFWQYLNLSGMVAELRQTPEERAKAKKENVDALLAQLDTDGNKRISSAEVNAVGDDGLVIDAGDDGKLTYSKDELSDTLKAIQDSDPTGIGGPVEQSHWRAAALDQDLLSQLNTDKKEGLSLAEVETIADSGIYVGGVTYAREDVIGTFEKVQKAAGKKSDEPLIRNDWLKAQSLGWDSIWLWPSIFCFVVLIFFALAFRDKPTEETKATEDS